MHPNPNSDPPTSLPLYSSHSLYYSQNPPLPLPFPNVYPDPPPTDLKPPGVDSFPSVSSVPQPTRPPAVSCGLADSASSCKEAVHHYGADPTGYGGAASVSAAKKRLQPLAVAQPASTPWTNYAYQPQRKDNSNKCQKKEKVVQSAYCEICKLDCNSKDVLDKHKLGKPHKKKLESVSVAQEGLQQQLAVAQPASTLAICVYQPEGNENLNKRQKKTKVVQSAYCEVCKVYCNNKDALDKHKLGKKHKIKSASVSVSQEGLQLQLAVGQPASTLANYVLMPEGDENSNKRQKTMKVVPSTYCEVCKVDCNSKDVLNKHKLGRKHKKKLESVSVAQEGLQQQLAVVQPPSTLAICVYQPEGNKNSNKLQKTTKVVPYAYCEVCEVDCKSKDVLDKHKLGKKHKKKLESVSVAQEGLQQQLAVAQPASNLTNYIYLPNGNENSNKRQKTTNVLPSAYCQVCKVDCNSEDVFDKHNLGKKDEKKLESVSVAQEGLQQPLAVAQSASTLINYVYQPAGTENINKCQVVPSASYCEVCKVQCNSKDVLDKHKLGKKHIKKSEAGLQQQMAVVQPTSTQTNNVNQPKGNENSIERQKKPEVVPSAYYCEVCKVACNSKYMFDNHNSGKKHKKNLEKSLVASAVPSVSSLVSHNHSIGPQLDPEKATSDNIQRTEPLEDLEAKRRKVVEGRAAQVCALCNATMLE